MRTTAALALFLLAGSPDGERAPDFTLNDVQGKPQSLYALKEKKAIVLLFTGIECPRARASEPRLADLAAKHGPRGAAFLAVNSNWNESVPEIVDYLRKAGAPFPVLKDERNRVADLYKVEVQPTAIVLDADFKVRYRGLIDDHKVEEFVRNRYLDRAIGAVLEGKEPEVARTEPAGCRIRRLAEEVKSKEVTYTRHVAPILNRHCLPCHRPGQVGPFTLENYEQASAWSAEIVSYVKRGAMPPWKPVSNEGLYYNERRLGPEETALLEKWLRNGCPEGDAADLPAPPKFHEGWMLGTPDLVLRAEGGYEVAARGKDEYRCYVLQNPYDEDKWVTGVEFKPGNPRAVHHVIGYLDLMGQSERKDAADPLPGYKTNGSGPNIIPSGSLAGWAPGNLPRMLPEGTGRLWRKGERIVLETHYHRTGRKEVDGGTEVALHFAKKPVKKQLQVHMIAAFMLRIPPGEANYRTGATYTVPRDVHAMDVMPHMHLLGQEASVVATFPDGTKKDLVVIKDWDFNWQETYQFKEPLALPKGTKIRLEARYDNSLGNPNNPSNPPKMVGWGEQTTDEMCIAFIHFTNDSEDRTKPKEGDR